MDYRAMARAAAMKYDLNPDYFAKQIEVESNFNPRAFNARSGASGIAQIIPKYHPNVDVWDAAASLDYAARWMHDLQRRYLSLTKALIAYNWGPNNLETLWEGNRASLPKETATYLDKILGTAWDKDPKDVEMDRLRRVAWQFRAENLKLQAQVDKLTLALTEARTRIEAGLA